MTMLAAPKIAISYANGPKIQSPVGPTLLEISRGNGIVHTSECGGRARCGTCRVRITEGGAALPTPSLAERFTLARVKAPQDARLACQIRPTAALTVLRLVQAGYRRPDALTIFLGLRIAVALGAFLALATPVFGTPRVGLGLVVAPMAWAMVPKRYRLRMIPALSDSSW